MTLISAPFFDFFTKKFALQKKEGYGLLQELAWNAFTKRGPPTKADEDFQYLKLIALSNLQLFGQTVPCEKKEKSIAYKEGYRLLFRNGAYIPEESSCPKGVEILPFSKAIHTYHTLIESRSLSLAKERDPFLLLNGAFCEEGAFLYIPPKLHLDKPITIFFESDLATKAASSRIHIVLGAKAMAKIIVQTPDVAEGKFFSSLIDLSIGEAASLSMFSESHREKGGWEFDYVRALLKKGASFESFLSTAGGKAHRTDYHVQLVGEGARCDLSGIWALKKDFEAHVHVLMELSAPYCQTMQVFKGALLDMSRSSFQGKILVNKEAQKTESYQLNNNLLLSPKAQAFSKPNLRISADDVKASHGATFGRISEEALFYFVTRGLSRKKASLLLTKAFFEELFAKISHPEFLARVHDRISLFLNEV